MKDKLVNGVKRFGRFLKRNAAPAVAAVTVAVSAVSAHAQTDPDVGSIVSGASTTFTAVATLCVSIGVFFVGYRIAKKVR